MQGALAHEYDPPAPLREVGAAETPQLQHAEVANRARALVVQHAGDAGRPELADDAAIVVSELVTNAALHAGGCTRVEVIPVDAGLRVEVYDGSRHPPVLGHASDNSLTGRGLRIVASLSAAWGADVRQAGKVVWAEVTGQVQSSFDEVPDEDLLAMWADDWGLDDGDRRWHVEIGDVPTDLLLAAKAHVDNIAREFALATAGADAGITAAIPSHLASLLQTVESFAEARLAIKHQALQALRLGLTSTHLELDLPASVADAAEQYMKALDEVDNYSRATRLLTLESPPQHRAFRHWYITELVAQLRAAEAGLPRPQPMPFERWLLAELDRVVATETIARRGARLASLASALASAATPESVSEAVLSEGVAALGAAGGGVLLATSEDTLALPGAVGYDDEVVARLRSESRDAELPAAVALRTGQAVWLESQADRDARFPELAGLEANTVSLCAVPLTVDDRRLGALRFSFTEARLFDDDERNFVRALAALTAQAMDRANLQLAQVEAAQRLQRSLMPPSLPEIPHLEIAALYRPYGRGLELGGDFYDAWMMRPGMWAVGIGDVSGKGPEAAAVAARIRHTIRALTMTHTAPHQLLEMLNTALVDAAERDDTDDRFCTMLLGVVTLAEDGRTFLLQLASGGHPPAVVVTRGGHVDIIEVGGGLVGAFEVPDVAAARVELHPGDSVILFTDGVLEARSSAGAMFGLAGLTDVLVGSHGGASRLIMELERAVLDHTGGKLSDDVAAIVLRVPG